MRRLLKLMQVMPGKEFHLASARLYWIFWTAVLVVIVLGIDKATSARGVRIGGGFRSGGTRYSVRTSSGVRYTSHSTRVRVRYNTYRPWRSWHSYGSSGHIYGYVYYTRTRHYYSNRDREPTICYNGYDNFMENGTNYEWFICPNISNPDNYDACCGDEDRQYCCKSSMDTDKEVAGIVLLILFFSLLDIFFYCLCRRKKNGRKSVFQECIMSKHRSNRGPSAAVHYRNGVSGNTAESTNMLNPPMNGPNVTYPQTDQPNYPPVPPSTQPMYPPQPSPGYQNGSYPHGSPEPYPPGAGVQPGSGLPYSVQPPVTDLGIGYPPNPPGACAPPYPTDGIPDAPLGGTAPPYPTNENAAPPYPPYPADGSFAPPYPTYPTDGTPFPLYPPQPQPSGPYSSNNYPATPPPTYSSLN